MRKLFLSIALIGASALAAAPTPKATSNTSVLTWTAVTTGIDQNGNTVTLVTPVTYNVLATYAGTAGTYSQIASALTATTYTDASASLTAGVTACYEVTATSGGVTGATSNASCKTFPLPTPAAPANLVVK